MNMQATMQRTPIDPIALNGVVERHGQLNQTYWREDTYVN
jgi:hypothetical protein